jgi:hypothetical protein
VLEGTIFTYLLYSKDTMLYRTKGTDRGASGQLADRFFTLGTTRIAPYFHFRSCARREWGNQFTGGEVIEGAEAAGELVGAQAAVAVERAYKFHGVAVRLQWVAIQTARDEVAVGIAAEAGPRDDVIEAPSLGNEAAQTIEAMAALAGVDRVPARLNLEEVDLPEAICAWRLGWALGCGPGSTHSLDFLRQPDTNDMMGLATAFD